MRLLVIEHDHLLRDNLVHHLRQRGFTVLAGTAREEVGRALGNDRIDVVLLGLGGLRRQGLALLSLIRQDSPGTEVILMTTSDCLHLSIEGMKLGAFDDIQVPYDIDILCAKIKKTQGNRDRTTP